ncbi:MAG: Glycosyl transferase [Candidatus Magasanikbacteria bacterium GW2011_GWC2_34_16]|uniref:Glycosyl transferase n=1 Tax=Candidatus Magasanikbacteria bacterium GW2011_GWC2_34_16 TaxID=1619045 RepID=A0A0G0B678_9BACT|nr:MAG: Glycosyl transferase [Candidatus Magasanikbacteria bacterium GW2011_GWC2_34_16]
MRGLYIAFEYNIEQKDIESLSDGIKKKIIMQINTFREYNHSIDFYNPYTNRNKKIHKILRRLPFFRFISWSKLPQNITYYDYIYIRKPWFMDGDLIKFLRHVKRQNNNLKILLEIPTYPYDHEAKKLNILPLFIKDIYWRRKLFKYVHKIITYSNDDLIFKTKTIVVSNGIDTDRISSIKNTVFDPRQIHLIACSSFYFWHGYDRLIKGIAEYYKSKQNIQVFLHMVGAGDQQEHYNSLVKEYKIENFIIFYGKVTGLELDNIYEKADVAIDSLGRHRSKVYFNSSLKGKEYLAKGLPIVSGVITELDFDNTFKYYLRVPANDDSIQVNDIINFVNEIYSNSKKSDVIKSIRGYAVKRFDYKTTFEPIINYLERG